MSSSYNYKVVAMTPEQIAVYANSYSDKSARCRVAKSCQNTVAFYTEYRYTTGRGGRTTTSVKSACPEHARRFAEKNRLKFPPESPLDRLAQEYEFCPGTNGPGSSPTPIHTHAEFTEGVERMIKTAAGRFEGTDKRAPFEQIGLVRIFLHLPEAPDRNAYPRQQVLQDIGKIADLLK